MNSNRQSAPAPAWGMACAERMPSSSISTSSPGPTSRSWSAPTMSSAPVVVDRLRVRPWVGAGRRVSGVADCDLALEAAQVLLVEDLGDEAHVAQHGEAAAVGDGDARGLLSPVLKGEQPEVRDAGDVTVRGANAEDSAHLGGYTFLPGLLQLVDRDPEQSSAHGGS